MIKASDLRIGNWVNYDVGEFPATIISLDYIGKNPEAMFGVILPSGESYFQVDDYMIKPIPLTPTILIQCGFNRQPQQNKYGDSSFSIFIIENKFYWARSTDNYGDIEESVEIKYLHQLQNLYYILNGQELTINI